MSSKNRQQGLDRIKLSVFFDSSLPV